MTEAVTDIPSALQDCIDEFWKSNPELQRTVLQDWYVRGYVQHTTNDAGRAAVDKWLAQNTTQEKT